MKLNLRNFEKFEQRHNGSNATQTQAMLDFIKATSLSQLIDQTIPKSIQLKKPTHPWRKFAPSPFRCDTIWDCDKRTKKTKLNSWLLHNSANKKSWATFKPMKPIQAQQMSKSPC